MFNLIRLQSRLLEAKTPAAPVEITEGIKETFLRISVIHRTPEGLNLLPAPIKVDEEEGKVRLNGAWTLDEMDSIMEAMKQVCYHARLVVADAKGESAIQGATDAISEHQRYWSENREAFEGNNGKDKEPTSKWGDTCCDPGNESRPRPFCGCSCCIHARTLTNKGADEV